MFYDELRYRVIYLSDARSIAMTCFFSHKTISNLDLQINQPPDNHSFRFDSNPFLLDKSFFSTEESLRNSLLPRRRLLYTLNLDFPEGREYSNLRNGPAPRYLPPGKSLFVAIRDSDSFFKKTLSKLLEYTFNQTDCKLNLLKWMLDFRPLKFVYIPPSVQYSCAKFLYHECVDAEFARAVLRNFIDLISFLETGDLKVLEYILYQSRLSDFNPRRKSCCCWSLTDFMVARNCYRFVDSFLKYEATANCIEENNEECNCQNFSDDDISMDMASKLRYRRVQQIISVYYNQEYFVLPKSVAYTQEASAALRLVWRSIPDSYITLQEMKDCCNDIFTVEVASETHEFYEEAIHQTVSCLEPRSLSHYCRTVIRKTLYNSKQWLPEGIKQLNLPPRVESFLNLQRDHVRPDNIQTA